MCWSSVTCSRLVSYAHWPLGRGEALMFGDFFAAKEFSRTSDCCGQTYNLKSLLGKYSGIWIFFFPLVNTCVLAGDEQRAVAGEKLRCLFPAVLISAVLLNSCGWTLSAWCQPCSDEICSCSIWIYSNIFQSCAWKVFFFFFLFPYPLPFSVKALSRDQQICNPDLHYPMLGLWDFLLQRLEPGSKLIEKKDVTILSRYESNMEYTGTHRTGL